MDVQAIRERLLSGFKPKTKNIDTPYLEDLDGELMLQGLSGKQMLDLNEQATEQTIAKDGTATNTVNGRKIAALTVQSCLRARSNGEPVYSLVDVLGENGDGNGALLDLDNAVFTPLIHDIYTFIGKKPAAEIKAELKKTDSASDTSSLLQDSAEPLTNSLTESTAQS